MLYLKTTASLAVIATLSCATVHAQETQNTQPQENTKSGGVQQIVVTATKRSADLQDVPVAVQALGQESLEQLGVTVFDDYLQQLPGVTAGGGGPGQSTIYIRGLASTTPNLTTAGVAGLAPNVALYLDEQPVSQPGRNLDVYAADLERVEVLSGPQGTLFGASSQAGTVRLITNKPVIGEYQAKIKAGLSFTKSGDPSQNIEAVFNIPVGDRFAIRAVGYYDNKGGYIDNVAGTRSAAESGRFREAGTVRDNGVPVSAGRQGFQAGGPAAGTNFILADNSALVDDNINDTQYLGFRVSGKYEFNNDWSITVAHARQGLDSDGVFFQDPTLGDLEIQRFEQDEISDDFNNTSWTVEGRLGALDLVYTGAFTNRETTQRVDYSDYLFVGQYLPYYICDTAVVYPGSVTNAPADPTCQAPNLFVNSQTDTEVFTQELRFNTPEDNRFRVTAGGFYSKLTLRELNDFAYPGSEFVRGSDGVTTGFLPNFALTNINSPAGAAGNASDGFFTDAGAFPAGVIFRNDIERTDEQFGIFGEASFDLVEDVLTITGGIRYFNVDVDLEGSANSSFFNLASPVFGPNVAIAPADRLDAQLAGTNISATFGPNNTVGAPDSAQAEGVIFKGTVTYTPNDDLLFYATYSEGFRPGLLNRPGGATGPNGFIVPFALETDDVRNYELGWKMSLFDNQVRFNGNAFFVEVENLQTTIFDPSITNLFFSDNAANAEILGIEGDLTIAPFAIEGLTISAGFSFLDTQITDVLTPTDDVVVGDSLAFAPTFQGNLRARYEWEAFGDWTAHIQPQITHSGSAATDIITINRLQLDSWTTLGMTAGLSTDRYSLEIFGDNLTDTRAQTSGNFINDRARITVNRPLTIGARVSFTY